MKAADEISTASTSVSSAPTSAVDQGAAPSGPHTTIRRSLTFLLAISTGLCVASMYYAQPLLGEIGTALHISATSAGLIVSLMQVGYMVGLCFLVPLGDLFPRRRLLPAMVIALALSLFAVAASPNVTILLICGMFVGALSVAAQVGVAFAASVASDADRGQVVGTVMSGLLLGILLARTVSGYLAELGGWRTPYWVAGIAMVVLTAVLVRALPTEQPRTSTVSYRQLIGSVFSLIRQEPVLRLRSLLGAAAFGAFNALWTPLAFLLSASPFHYSPATIGLFGLLGLMGALAASFAGRLADRGRSVLVTTLTAALLLVVWVPIELGRHHLVGLIVGILVLDLAVQGLHITNQHEIYKLRPEARSRLTSAYMGIYFLGGVLGSLASSIAYNQGGWSAACIVGGIFGLVATVLAVVNARSAHRAASTGL